MLCWFSHGFWSGKVLGLTLDRLRTESQRGPGASLKVQHKIGQRLGPELGAEGRSQPGPAYQTRGGVGVCRQGPPQG